MRLTPGRFATIILVFVLNPITVGMVTGWLVGVSREPVFSIVIPLVFGLLGVLGVGAAVKLMGTNTIGELIGGLIQPKRATATKSAANVVAPPSIVDVSLLALLSISSLCCSVSFLSTAKYFSNRRVPQYTSIKTLTKNCDAVPQELAQLYQIRFALLKANYSLDEYERIVRTTLIPLLPQDGTSRNRTDEANVNMGQAIKRLMGNSLPATWLHPAAEEAPAPPPPGEAAPSPPQ